MLRLQPSGGLYPVTDDDKALLSGFNGNQGVRCNLVRVKPRSIQHHRLYWAGLIPLAMHYWQPEGGLIARSELATLEKFSTFLGVHGGNKQVLEQAKDLFLEKLIEKRRDSIHSVDSSKQALHLWIKEKTGYYDIIDTPEGLRKNIKSINFNAMDQDEFSQFYKSAFGVVWDFILSRQFNNEEQAQNAVDQLLGLDG